MYNMEGETIVLSGAVLIYPFPFPKRVHFKILVQLVPEHCNISSIGVVFLLFFPAVKGINTLARCTQLLTDSLPLHQLNLE